MKNVHINVKLTSPTTNKSVTTESLVDTGATFTTVPKGLSEELKLPRVAKRKVTTASGEEELTESYLLIELLDEKTMTSVLISDKLNRVLVGALTLEALALKVDPRTGLANSTTLPSICVNVFSAYSYARSTDRRCSIDNFITTKILI